MSTHATRQRNSIHVQMVTWSIYDTRHPKHPHSPMCCYEQHPYEPPSWTHYMESYLGTAYYTLHIPIRLLHQHIWLYRDLCKHAVSASRTCTLSCQLSDAIAVICVGSFALVTISDLIQTSFSDLFWILVHTFVFGFIHIIQVPFQSRFMESHIGQSGP